jgi:hypothetical protein
VTRLRHQQDPAAYVISANIHRRHLTKAAQADLIVAAVEAAQRNDVAPGAKSSRQFSPEVGKKGGSTKDPVRAAALVEAVKHDISPRTVDAALARRRGKPTKPKRKPKLTPKRADAAVPDLTSFTEDAVKAWARAFAREINRQRTANHDQRMKGGWRPYEIDTAQQTSLLNWIEAQLARVVR